MEDTLIVTGALIFFAVYFAFIIKLNGWRWLLGVFKDLLIMFVIVAIDMIVVFGVVFGLRGVLPAGYGAFLDNADNTTVVAFGLLVLIFIGFFALSALLAKFTSRHNGPMREKMVVSRRMYGDKNLKTGKKKR